MHNFQRASLFLLLLALAGCARKDVTRRGEIKLRGETPVSVARRKPGDLLQRGIASWYGNPYHGRRTANGERYDMEALTAAHKTLPFGTQVTVLNRDNGRRVKVRINDRGPFIRGRIIDLSRRAARELDMLGSGTAEVAIYLETTAGEANARVTRDSEVRASAGGYWTIQVGSFAERNRAERLARDLKAYGGDVRLEPAGSMTRVRIGRFHTKSETFSLAETLSEQGMEPWILFAEN